MGLMVEHPRLARSDAQTRQVLAVRLGVPPEPVAAPADPDPWRAYHLHARANGLSGRRTLMRGRYDAKHTASERDAIERSRYGECRAQLSRPGAEIVCGAATATLGHERQALDRLERAYQHGLADARRHGHHIEAPVNAVASIHVGTSGRAKHAGVPRCHAAICMACRVVVTVRFRLDNPARDARPADVTDKDAADQIRRNIRCRSGEERTMQGRHGSLDLRLPARRRRYVVGALRLLHARRRRYVVGALRAVPDPVGEQIIVLAAR